MLRLFVAVVGAGALRGVQGQACDCNCCALQAQLMAPEVDPGTSAQCMVTSECPETCYESPQTAMVTDANNYLMDYNRFCVYSCTSGAMSLGAVCTPITMRERLQMQTFGGNARLRARLGLPGTLKAMPPAMQDPDPPIEKPQLMDALAVQQLLAQQALAASLQTGTLGAAGLRGTIGMARLDNETGVLVAEAAGKQALAAGLEARAAKAEAETARLAANASDSLLMARSGAKLEAEAQAQVAAAAIRAAVYKNSTNRSLHEIQVLLADMSKIPDLVYEKATGEALDRLHEEVYKTTAKLASLQSVLSPAEPAPIPEAASRAAAPYYDAMQKAMSVSSVYDSTARDAHKRAQDEVRQSRQLSEQAVAYQGSGYPDMAKELMAQAQALITDAQAQEAKAQEYHGVANTVYKKASSYQANADAAAARAAALANPPGQPPPPRPALLQRAASRPSLRLRARAH